MLCNCAKIRVATEKLEPEHFKTQIPFEIWDRRIIILTDWGRYKEKHTLIFDTHAPSSADTLVLKASRSISKINGIFYKITTADGINLKGNVYICDSIGLGKVKFNNAVIYDISQPTLNGWNRSGVTEVFGDNLISRGIWKIDFEHNLLTFGSDIDSIDGWQNAIKIPARFTNNIISVKVFFSNRIHHWASVDLGYGGFIIMPIKQFKQMDTANKGLIDSQSILSTSTGRVKGIIYRLNGEIEINNNYFKTGLTANQSIKEIMLGAGFFSQFKFIILDYKNNSIYISKK
jgi:hypothetical protein